MIPRYLPHLVALAAIVAGFLWYGHSRYQAGYEAHSAEVAAERAAAMERAERVTSQAAAAYTREDNALTDRIIRIDPGPVWLCPPAPSLRIPEPARSDDGPAESGRPDLSVGRDIGRAALVLAVECERDRRKLSALQDWIRAQSEPAK